MPRTSHDAPLMIGTSAIEMRPRRARRVWPFDGASAPLAWHRSSWVRAAALTIPSFRVRTELSTNGHVHFLPEKNAVRRLIFLLAMQSGTNILFDANKNAYGAACAAYVNLPASGVPGSSLGISSCVQAVLTLLYYLRVS